MEPANNGTESADVVVAAVDRAILSAVLSAIHRGGYGHIARVLDPERGDVAGQLRRAGVSVPLGFVFDGTHRVAVMISAAARTLAAAALLRQLGASEVWTTDRTTAPIPLLIGSLSNLTTQAGRSRSRRHQSNEPLAD
jgi:hypothetical protein